MTRSDPTAPSGIAAARPRLARLGHVALRTPDLDGSLRFFHDVVGLDLVERTDDGAYLRAWGDFEHHTLALLEDAEGALDHVGWRAAAPEHVDWFAAELRGRAVDVEEVPSGAERGQGRAIRFATPSGLPYEIYFDVEKPRSDRPGVLKTNSGRVWDHGVSPRRLDHVNVTSPRADVEDHWSRDALGFAPRELIRDGEGRVAATWLAVSALAHDLAVGRNPARDDVGLHHVAFYLDGASDVLRAAEIFAEHGIRPDHGPGRHAISQAVCIYARDPASGHRVELYSGSYIVLDPDWEPVEWTPAEYRQWWGPEPVRGDGSAMDIVTPVARAARDLNRKAG